MNNVEKFLIDDDSEELEQVESQKYRSTIVTTTLLTTRIQGVCHS